MPSIFTRIIQGELPGTFVHRDDKCVAFMSIQPLRPGHTLVVPIQEVDHWIDLPEELIQHLFTTAQRLSQAIQRAFQPRKVGLMVAGLEVPHVHLHLVPIHQLHDLDFSRQDKQANPADIAAAAEKIRQAH